jgi:hypothetical protein
LSFGELTSGAVIHYPYLWSHEASRGETEGRKSGRPTVVGFRLPRSGGDAMLLFPITSKQPAANRFAAEIPDMEKRRAGLDTGLRLWIIFDEFNEDVIGRSYYLEADCLLGHFSRAFLLPLLREFIARRGAIRGINRNR